MGEPRQKYTKVKEVIKYGSASPKQNINQGSELAERRALSKKAEIRSVNMWVNKKLTKVKAEGSSTLGESSGKWAGNGDIGLHRRLRQPSLKTDGKHQMEKKIHSGKSALRVQGFLTIFC